LSEAVGEARGSGVGAQYTGVTALARVLTADEPVEVERAVDEERARLTSDLGLRRAFVDCTDAVYRFILFRVGGDRAAADDLLQDCCHEAAKHRQPPTDAESVGPWMFGIARNLLRRHWRRRKRDGRFHPLHDPAVAARVLERLESSELPPEAMLVEEEATQLMLAVTDLAPGEQQLLLGAYFEGRSHEELAIKRGLTVKAVEARLHRIRAKLRGMLRGDRGAI